MLIIDTFEFWIIIYILEFIILGQIIIGNYLKQNVKKTLSYMIYGLFFTCLFVGVLIFLANTGQLELMYFWAAAFVSILIFIISPANGKKLSKQFDTILEEIQQINDKLDQLHKNEK